MASKRELVLAALHVRLQTLAAPVLRGDVLPERIPATGLIILRDGKPGEPEVTLSPLTWFYEHRAELEVVIQAGSGRDALFDALASSIGALLAADLFLRAPGGVGGGDPGGDRARCRFRCADGGYWRGRSH